MPGANQAQCSITQSSAHRGPTLNDILPRLAGIRYLTPNNTCFGYHSLKSDEQSSYLTNFLSAWYIQIHNDYHISHLWGVGGALYILSAIFFKQTTGYSRHGNYHTWDYSTLNVSILYHCKYKIERNIRQLIDQYFELQ